MIHILLFFPYSLERGFSIVDVKKIYPHIGNWKNIADIKENFKLMFDGLFNHVSSKNRWFQEFLNGNPQFQDFFIIFSTKGAISEGPLKLIIRSLDTIQHTERQTFCLNYIQS